MKYLFKLKMIKSTRILLLILWLLIPLIATTWASGSDLIGITNLNSGELKSGVFTIDGVVFNNGSIAKVAVKTGSGPWEAAQGIATWSYTVNTGQIVLNEEDVYDSAAGKLVKIYRRGSYYGDLNINIGAFNANDEKLTEKTVTVKIIPDAPYSDIDSGVYDSPLNVILKAAPELAIYYTDNGLDPKENGILYTGAIPVSQDKVIKAVAKSANNLYSAIYTLNLKITNGITQPSYKVQYYSDEALNQPLPDPPYLKAGTYYLKVITNQKLSAAPYLNILAPGGLNDVNHANLVFVSDCVYRYTRTITADNAASGDTQETIQLSGTDINGNQLQNTLPSNAAINTAFPDTQPPASGVISVESGPSINDPTPYLIIDSSGADQMRLALSEAALGATPWIKYATRYDGLDISSGGNGNKTIWIEFKDRAGNIQTLHAHTTVNYNDAACSFDIEYYSDPGLTHSLGANPHLTAGAYYLKITANRDLFANPTITINAEGANNDLTNGITTKITNRIFYYTRTVVPDPAITGVIKESIIVMGQIPSNADTNSAYTVYTVKAQNNLTTDTAQYILTITNNGHGNTTPSGVVTVNDGASTAISATPKPGYHFFNWSKTGGTGTVVFGDLNSVDTTVTVTGGDATIKAKFLITLTVTNNGYGNTTPSGDITVNEGASTAISATSNAGYHFSNWVKTAGTGTAVFGDANSANTMVTVTGGDATIKARFIINQYTLTIIKNGQGNTTPSGAVTVNEGASTAISATPNAGYHFSNWVKTAGTGTVLFGDPNSANTTVTVTGGMPQSKPDLLSINTL
jgi:hypothetical protein